MGMVCKPIPWYDGIIEAVLDLTQDVMCIFSFQHEYRVWLSSLKRACAFAHSCCAEKDLTTAAASELMIDCLALSLNASWHLQFVALPGAGDCVRFSGKGDFVLV